jgi:hypothetical protein
MTGKVIQMGQPFDPEKVNLHKVFEDGMWQIPPGGSREDTYVETEDYDRLLMLYRCRGRQLSRAGVLNAES